MKLTIYQNGVETYLWTREQLENIKKVNPQLFTPGVNHPYDFVIDNIDVSLIVFKNGIVSDIGFEENDLGDINVFVIYYSLMKDQIDHLYNELKKYSNYKFVLINKHTEDYWVYDKLMSNSDLLDKFDELTNVKILWDIEGMDYKNFIFHPKIAFHNYHSQGAFQSGAIFEHSYPFFKKIRKDYRIGFHINKRTTKVRKFLGEYLQSLNHPNLFFTSTDTFKSKIFDTGINFPLLTGNITSDWYLKQFVEMTVNSEMEIVYETSTHNVPFKYLVKWNEKTIKLLFLAKPFIHADPISHSLLKVFGLEPYTSLYTNSLLEYYNSFSHKDLIQSEDRRYFSETQYDIWLLLLKENIDWLLSLSDSEFKERIDIANDTADRNRERIHKLIYDTPLLPIITHPNFFN